MKASGMLTFLASVVSATAIPFPQFFRFPTSPTGGLGGTSTGTGSGFGSGSSNDVTNNVQPCRTYSVIFARGTNEGGNIGSVIGPQLQKALISKLGANGVAFQGVPYPATSAGNTNGGGTGPSLMTSLAQQAKKQCPDTKLVISGYSQGGIVVHNAAKTLGSTPLAGAVIFGDPFNGQSVANVPAGKLKEYCAQGDSICSRGRKRQTLGSGHLSYGGNAADAANFIASL